MSKAHILVVEDDKNVAAGLKDIFSVQGYTVLTAENNRDALSILQTETVDLTVLDISLGEKLLYLIWDKDASFVEANTLNVNISRLREKLGSYEGCLYIETVRGIGYRWAVPLER